jgi:hypothetical protein
VTTTVFTALSSASASSAPESSSRSAIDNAFFFSVRLSVSVATPFSGPVRSTSRSLTGPPGSSLTARQISGR